MAICFVCAEKASASASASAGSLLLICLGNIRGLRVVQTNAWFVVLLSLDFVG